MGMLFDQLDRCPCAAHDNRVTCGPLIARHAATHVNRLSIIIAAIFLANPPAILFPLVVLRSGESWPPASASQRPVISAAGENAAVVLKGAVTGARVRPFRLENAYRGIEIGKNALVSDLRIEGMEAHVARNCIRVFGTNIFIRNVSCTMSGAAKLSMSELPEGIHIRGGSDIHVENSRIEGFQTTLRPDQYWNGDGVAAERGIANLSFTDVTSDNNTDAGFDIKSPVKMDRMSAAGNCRNYRFWSDADIGTMQTGSVVKRGGISDCVGIWVKGSAQDSGPTIRIRNLVVRTPRPIKIIKVDGGSANITIDHCSIVAPPGTELIASPAAAVRIKADPSCRVR
jgi:hypothetical protein